MRRIITTTAHPPFKLDWNYKDALQFSKYLCSVIPFTKKSLYQLEAIPLD